MPIPDRISNPLCHVIDGTSDSTTAPQDLYLIPLNSEAKTQLDAWWALVGAFTTIALTQIDAGRGGYAQTGEDYKAIKLDMSS